MTGVEWVSIITLALGLIGHILKVCSYQQEAKKDVDYLKEWKKKMESESILTLNDYSARRLDCRTEIYKDFNKLELRFDKFLETMAILDKERKKESEETRSEIRGMRDSLIRVITLLEDNK